MTDLARVERELHRSVLRDSFAAFLEWAWPLVTGVPLVWNDALRALVQALQDVADGKVTRLLVAISPGTGKTTTVDCYTPWRLARNPGHRTIRASHAYEIAATSSRRVRRLIEGDAYRAMFPGVRLREDESTVAHWATTADGRYISTGTDGALTGRRAHEALLDDPLNAIDRFSKAARDTLWNWFQESLSTRLDGDRAPIVVVQQRLDRDDLIGKLLAAGGWTLVEIPAEDEHGNPTAPNVLGREKLDTLKKQIGSLAYQTQYLQRPHSDETSLFRRSWLTRRWTEMPAGGREVIALDATFKEGSSSDFAVIQCWKAVGADRFLVEQWRRQAGFADTLAALKAMAQRHPFARVVVELAANGHAIVDQLRREVPAVFGVKPVGSKVARAASVQAIVESGAVVLPAHAPWLEEWLDEVCAFTAEGSGAAHDDVVDAMGMGLRELAAAAAVTSVGIGGWVVTADRSGPPPYDGPIAPSGFSGSRSSAPVVETDPVYAMYRRMGGK